MDMLVKGTCAGTSGGVIGERVVGRARSGGGSERVSGVVRPVLP